jgi:alanyl-tRNA synthetase
LANQAVLRSIPVKTAWLPRNEAESRYGFRLYQGGAVPGKEIRVVRVGDWDVEACAGTHLKNTGEIGFIKIIHTERVQDGVERLAYSIGIPAVKIVQRNERLLVKLTEALSAPLEKLDKTAEKIMRDLKEANLERRRLIKELAVQESVALGAKAEAEKRKEIGGIRLLIRDFHESIDVDRMVHTASEIVKSSDQTVTIFYGANDMNARILVMAGKGAVERGINANEIAREASAILGGGGGGKTNFAQGGGSEVKMMPKAVKKAEELLRRQLTRKT